MSGEKEPDSVPDIIPDVTPDTPAEEAPVVPDHPQPDAPAAPESHVEEKLDTLISGIADLAASIGNLATAQVTHVPDESPKPVPWTHRRLGRGRD